MVFFPSTIRFACVVIQIRKISSQLSPVTLSFSFQDIPYFPIYLQININSLQYQVETESRARRKLRLIPQKSANRAAEVSKKEAEKSL